MKIAKNLILICFLSPEKRLILELCHRVDGDKVCWVPTTKKVKLSWNILGIFWIYWNILDAHQKEGTILIFLKNKIMIPLSQFPHLSPRFLIFSISKVYWPPAKYLSLFNLYLNFNFEGVLASRCLRSHSSSWQRCFKPHWPRWANNLSSSIVFLSSASFSSSSYFYTAVSERGCTHMCRVCCRILTFALLVMATDF